MRHRSFVIWICPLLVCFLAVMGCSKEERSIYTPSAAPLTGDPGQENCGFDLGAEVPDGPIIDPCGPDAQLLHGPVTLNPDPGTPAQDSVVLPIPEEGFVCVTVNVEKIASATVTLNGEPLFEPRDFNARVSELSRVAAVEQGESLLEFEILATPHGSFTYQVRYIPLDPIPRGEVSGGNDRLSVYNLRDHPDPFSPEKQDGIRDTVTLHVTASVVRDGISPRSANEYVVYGTFEIASPDTCQEIARLTTQLTLAEATPTSTDRDYVVPLTVVWDGRDSSGAFVDGGTYFYRSVVELVKISPPGSSSLLDIAYSEILTVTNDDVPPVITITPANGETVGTDMPLLSVAYYDEGSGVNESTLIVILNGKDVTGTFDVTALKATSQVDIDWYLEEGSNQLIAGISDNAGNVGSEISVFTVHTPTSVLIADLDHADDRYKRRSAYKLLFRTDEITEKVLWKCLKQLNDTPEPKAVTRLLEMLSSEDYSPVDRSLMVGAVGEAAFIDSDTRDRSDVGYGLYAVLDLDPSWSTKWWAARALGQTMSDFAHDKLEDWVEVGPHYPPRPPSEDFDERIQWDALVGVVGMQTARSLVRISGPQGNPFTFEDLRDTYLYFISRYLENVSGDGGGP